MKKISLRLVADWQDIDVVFDDEVPDSDYIVDSDCVQGIWIDGDFVPLDIFMRYGTAWIGNRPDCVDESGNDITVHGVSVDLSYPYLVEINDSTQQIRVWKELGTWYGGE